MKFRIIRYYDFYKTQVYDAEKNVWKAIGTPNGYSTMAFARTACKRYKEEQDNNIVEEFEL